jgi:trehalose 6-phosphate phosphatase
MTSDHYDFDRLALFLDIDGTLLDFAARPGDVSVPSTLIDDLQAIEARLQGALALVSGRSIKVIDDLFSPVKLRAAGAHGAEIRLDPHGDIDVVGGEPLSDALKDALNELAASVPGILVEDKGISMALHYRAAPTSGDALLEAMEALVSQSGDPTLGILPGRLVYEVKHLSHDKGTALRTLMGHTPFIGREPVFIGDDVTDEAGFAVVGDLGGVGYSVGRDIPGVKRGFDVPADVREWIADMADRIEARHTRRSA